MEISIMLKKLVENLLAAWEDRIIAFLIDFWTAIQLINIGMTNIFSSLISLDYQNILKYQLSIIIFLFIYWTLMEGLMGQSLGKIALGLKVVKSNGDPIGFKYAMFESFGKAFLLPFDLFMGWFLVPNSRLRLFNIWSDTIVISLDTRSKE
jgi:uncharacterized RDD family membrane protein YckC